MLGKLKYNDGKLENILEIPETIRAKYKETFEIDMTWLVRAAAERGKWIDQSQSLNIFFRGSSGRELSDIYFFAWSMGLKTTYYLRTMAASQVEKSTVDAGAYGATHTRKKEGGHKEGASEMGGVPTPEVPVQVDAPVSPAQAPMFGAGVASMHTAVSTPVPLSPSPIAVETLIRATVPVIAMMEPEAERSGPTVIEASFKSSEPIKQAVAEQPKKQYNIEKIEDAVCEACE